LNALSEVWGWLPMMAVLILLSALFSGSEAALFSLNQRTRHRLARAGLGGRIASRLLQDPERLLSAILFWNLLINMTYFAIAAIVAGKLEADPEIGRSVAVTFTVLSLLVIIFFSEMLPKSVAVMAPLRLAVMLGPPLSLGVKAVRPILPLVAATNLAASRLIWPNFKPEPEIDLADIERAIELGTDDAALLQRERIALRGLVEMAEIRVGELMRTRNKLWICQGPPDRSVIIDGIPIGGYLLVADQEGTVVQSIRVRMLRPSQLDNLAGSAEPVIYAPWSALVSQVLDELFDQDLSVAVVVDEFGELLGALSIDDILRRVLAPSEDENLLGESAITEIDRDHYRVAGSVSVRALAKRLGIDVAGEGFTTVAGYIQRHNERLPRAGDSAPMEQFVLTVLDDKDDERWISVQLASDKTPESP
jgi:CBS domain containing-hemolysin-like protein